MSFVVKICGITTVADARAAVEAGADWLGFVFYPPSPRHVRAEQVREILAELPRGVVSVGVFVEPTAEELRRAAATAGLSRVQVHGHDDCELLASVAELQPIKVLALREEGDLAALRQYPDVQLLLDTPTPEWGGSGKTGNWDLAARAAAERPILLAGGLTPENVAAAIEAVHPAGVDVSSGVERARGLKDHDKVRAFVEAARRAAGL